jgi:hypothetical protein
MKMETKPNRTQGETKPNTTHGVTKPNATQGETKQNTRQWETKPNTRQGETNQTKYKTRGNQTKYAEDDRSQLSFPPPAMHVMHWGDSYLIGFNECQGRSKYNQWGEGVNIWKGGETEGRGILYLRLYVRDS